MKTLKILAVNGSPRKRGNTQELVEAMLEGARQMANDDVAVETETSFIYDIPNVKGCAGCLGCKLANSRTYGHCVRKDDMTPLIEKASAADALVFASPLYYLNLTGEMRSFIERLFYPYMTYEAGFRTVAPKRMPTAFIYTMNMTEQNWHDYGMDKTAEMLEFFAGRIFGPAERLAAYNTTQVADYSRYRLDMFPPEEKAAYKAAHWEKDLETAREIGRRLVSRALK